MRVCAGHAVFRVNILDSWRAGTAGSCGSVPRLLLCNGPRGCDTGEKVANALQQPRQELVDGLQPHCRGREREGLGSLCFGRIIPLPTPALTRGGPAEIPLIYGFPRCPAVPLPAARCPRYPLQIPLPAVPLPAALPAPAVQPVVAPVVNYTPPWDQGVFGLRAA